MKTVTLLIVLLGFVATIVPGRNRSFDVVTVGEGLPKDRPRPYPLRNVKPASDRASSSFIRMISNPLCTALIGLMATAIIISALRMKQPLADDNGQPAEFNWSTFQESLGNMIINLLAVPILYVTIKAVGVLATVAEERHWDGWRSALSLIKLVPVTLSMAVVLFGLIVMMPFLILPADWVDAGQVTGLVITGLMDSAALTWFLKDHIVASNTLDNDERKRNKPQLAAWSHLCIITSLVLAGVLGGVRWMIGVFAAGFFFNLHYFVFC